MNFTLTTTDYLQFISCVAEKIAQNKDYITQLDAKVGDGDHWANMNKGFSTIVSATDSLSNLSLKELFSKIGMLLMCNVGGSSGALYGSAYLKAANAIGDREVIDTNGLLEILEAKLDAIMERGKAKPGFKTMLDPLYQATVAYRQSIEKGNSISEALSALRQGAIDGMNATKDMPAVKGRASYQQDKGVGQLDPGAVTMCYQLETLAEICKSKIA